MQIDPLMAMRHCGPEREQNVVSESLPNSTLVKPKHKNRRRFWSAIVVIVIWFGASGVFGPLFGKLSTVQENDNSAFLPDSAEAPSATVI